MVNRVYEIEMSTQDDPEVHIGARRNSRNVLWTHTSNIHVCRARTLDGRQDK